MDLSANRALTLLVATIEPPSLSSIRRASARMTSQTPLALVPTTRSQSSAEASRSNAECPIPAVTVTNDGTPIRSIVSSVASST